MTISTIIIRRGPAGEDGATGAAGAAGATGATGPVGPAPSGTGFVKVSGGSLTTPSATIPHTDITGLGTAATYATADLPVSTATQTALDGKAAAENWVFEGDSLTAANQGSGYVTWAEYIAANGRETYYNVATSGHRTDQMVSSFAADVTPRLTTVAGKPSLFFLLAGTNDSGTLTTTQTRDNLRTMWAAAKAQGAKVVAFTMPHRASGGWSAANQKIINDQIIADYASGLCDYLVRSDIIFSNSSSVDFVDGLHMTTAAQKKFAAEVLLALNGGLPSPALTISSAYLTAVTTTVNTTTTKLRFSLGFGHDRNNDMALGTIGGTANVTYFTAPVLGLYNVSARLLLSGMTAGKVAQLSIYILPLGGSAVEFRAGFVTASGATESVSAELPFLLGKGDIVYLELATDGSTGITTNPQFALFSVRLADIYR